MFKMNKKILVLFAVSITIPGIYAEPAEEQHPLTKTVSGDTDDNNNNNSRLKAALTGGTGIVTGLAGLIIGGIIGSRETLKAAAATGVVTVDTKKAVKQTVENCAISAHLQFFKFLKEHVVGRNQNFETFCKSLENDLPNFGPTNFKSDQFTTPNLKSFDPDYVVKKFIIDLVTRQQKKISEEMIKHNLISSVLANINNRIDTGVTQFRGLNDSNKNMLIGSGALLLTGYIYKKVWLTNSDKEEKKA